MNTKRLLTCLLVLSAGLLTNLALAQTESPYADETRPMINYSSAPVTFFWVAETNTRPVRQTIVRFYDHKKQLIYEEKLIGRCLNVHRKRVVRLLNRALAAVRIQWSARESLEQSELLVASQLKR